MARVRAKTAPRHAIANAASIAMIALLGAIAAAGIFLDGGGLTVADSLTLAAKPMAMLLLAFVFKATSDFSRLAFFAPFVLLLVNSLALAANEQHAHFYLLAALFICGISCLYSNFPQTLSYILLQAAAAAALFFLGFPVAGEDPSAAGLGGIAFIFLSCCAFLIVIVKTATVDLRRVSDEASSFRTYLAATKNYLAMLDSSNRIVYVSKPMSDLARIENPEATKGRPFIDLFPSRELKYLAYKMLGWRELREDSWEFTLQRQKRYFKAVSSGMVGGTGGGTLITMLDMTHLAERDEIAAMKDSLKIGLFFMDRGFAIQDNYSRHLEELMSDGDLRGKSFLSLLAGSIAPKELEAVRDYLDMVFDRTFDHDTLSEINPLNELHYVDPSGSKKIFHCTFLTVELGQEETVVLTTIYDVTAKVELQERLQREEKKRQEEMSNLFELLQVNPATFEAFREDMEHEFGRIDGIMGNEGLSNHEILVEVYQSVHAIKSNAVTLGLNNFGAKAHEVEAQIKRLRNMEAEIPFDDMLHITIEIEKLGQEKEGFKQILEKISAFKRGVSGKAPPGEGSFLEPLARTAQKVAADTGKKARLAAPEIDMAALEKGPKRVIKEALVQLIRNSVAHGIEPPEERAAAGKSEAGTIRLSAKASGGGLLVRLADDGRGIDFGRIREKALSLGLLSEGEAGSKSRLLGAIFAPGFSTADDEDGMHSGRGIGLNLVRDRVRGAGGTIKLQTEPGKGTAFSLFFPLEGGAAGAGAAGGSAKAAAGGSGAKGAAAPRAGGGAS